MPWVKTARQKRKLDTETDDVYSVEHGISEWQDVVQLRMELTINVKGS